MPEQEIEHSQLYVARENIHPRSVKGRFRNLKTGILVLAYGVYFLLPWLRWERESGPSQAVLFDIAGRKFYLFDLSVYPQDIFWLAGLLMLAAYLLFFVTNIAGRIFCGYFCFQTLWTDLYIFIEKWVQGERPARLRLDKSPWNYQKAFKLGLTHFLWLFVAFITGLSFVLYWGDAFELTREFFTGQAPFAAYATTLLLMATTYTMAGLAREQVCIYMCPYSRFQSAMFDKDTLIVSYDEKRGESTAGRSKRGRDLKTKEQRKAADVGDCIDCGFCVQVCPTGVDIREGLQIGCISCALCVDACDIIMDSLNWERGLVSYTSKHELSGNKKASLFRPKVLGYFAIMLIIIAALLWNVSQQSLFDIAVNQVRQPLYVRMSDGRIQNSYELKLTNKTGGAIKVGFDIQGLENAELDMGNFNLIELQQDQRMRLIARVRLEPRPGEKHQAPLRYQLRVVPQNKTDIEPIVKESVFYLPGME